jgi:hypothetical protein
MLLLCCRCAKVKLDRHIIINTENESVVPIGTKVLLELEKLFEHSNTKKTVGACINTSVNLWKKDLIFCSL